MEDKKAKDMKRYIVFLKQVPLSTKVEMDPVTRTLKRSSAMTRTNPDDLYALQLAVKLKRQTGAEIVAVSMGPASAEEVLREALQRGADKAVLLSSKAFAGSDTWCTSLVLAAAVRKLGEYDLLLFGKMAVDGDTAQIGPELAGAFEIPCVTDVSCVQSAGFTTCGSLALVHGCDAGEETVYLAMPCAMTTAKEIGQLRMPSIAGIRAAEEADVCVVSAADVNADPARCGLAGSPTQVVRSFVPDRDQTCEAVEGTASEQAVELAKIIEGMA